MTGPGQTCSVIEFQAVNGLLMGLSLLRAADWEFGELPEELRMLQ